MLTAASSSRKSGTREAWRARWRAFVLPHWPRLAREVLEADEAKVLSLRLGMLNDVGLTHRALARRLHVTENTIAATEKRAFAKVKAALHLEGSK